MKYLELKHHPGDPKPIRAPKDVLAVVMKEREATAAFVDMARSFAEWRSLRPYNVDGVRVYIAAEDLEVVLNHEAEVLEFLQQKDSE